MNPYVLLINVFLMNSYDQKATMVEFGKSGVKLFFFYCPLTFFYLMVLGPDIVLRSRVILLHLKYSLLLRKEHTECKGAIISMLSSLKEL